MHMSQTERHDPASRARIERRRRGGSAPRANRVSHRGAQHGPITRLVSPSDSATIKPFVFLDRAEVPFTGPTFMGIHPHSGIATLTTVLAGGMVYEDTTGKKGRSARGWTRVDARRQWRVARRRRDRTASRCAGFQLWVALPASEENAPSGEPVHRARGRAGRRTGARGPRRYGARSSAIRAPEGIDYFHSG